MIKLSGNELLALLDFPSLISALDTGFRTSVEVPQRHHHDYNFRANGDCSSLLLMPAWEHNGYLGVKIVTVTPENTHKGQPSIQGRYLLFDTKNGAAIAELDAPVLTNLRTAAASALASTYLSRPDSSSLLMIGTGSLAPFLMRAHASCRPIKHIYVWGRNQKKAQELSQIEIDDIEISAVDDLDAIQSEVDIISSATMTLNPLIKGSFINPGQHIDLVGSYKPTMREADDEVVTKSLLFYDTPQGLHESGDLHIPLSTGLIEKHDLSGNLMDLCRGAVEGRRASSDITYFKSVGHASEDLFAAKLAVSRAKKG